VIIAEMVAPEVFSNILCARLVFRADAFVGDLYSIYSHREIHFRRSRLHFSFTGLYWTAMRKTSGGLTEISLSKKLGRNCADLVEGVRDVFIRLLGMREISPFH
jgi:hypothetical protein